MSGCRHKNPLGFAYCVTCGAQITALRCPRCGFACDKRFLFCGGCGCDLRHETESEQVTAQLLTGVERRYDLADMVEQYSDKTAEISPDGKVSQDDIRAMIENLRKNQG